MRAGGAVAKAVTAGGEAAQASLWWELGGRGEKGSRVEATGTIILHGIIDDLRKILPKTLLSKWNQNCNT